MQQDEVRLNIIGGDVASLVGWLQRSQGWVFSHFEQSSPLRGYAVGYVVGADPRDYEGMGISDGTRIMSVVPPYDYD
jgi:hypothetical protein